MTQVKRWHVFTGALDGARDHNNPFGDVTARVHLTAPSGAARTIDAFWDGERAWRFRFAPDEVGAWRWRSECAKDAGLDGREGAFECAPYTGDNPLYLHGPVRLSDNRRHLVHADGTPFFWLADTAWNGVLKARPEDWTGYLRARRAQRFTAVQFVSTHWRALAKDAQGEMAFTGIEHIRLNPAFFQRLDAKVQAINDHGLVAAPVILWALLETDPGQYLAEADAVRVARYVVARWGAHQVIWLLGGDGNYLGERAARWRRIGRAAFGERPGARDRLVTMHPCGQTWVGPEFRGEPWFDFIGYQSGHGDALDHLQWLVMGPPATDWDTAPALPVINLEPNYEIHPAYQSRTPFTAYEVRRAAYWSLLISPTAGVTFGHNAIWPWHEAPAEPEGHNYIGVVPGWREGLDTPGVRSMTVLRGFFDALPWWTLRPAPTMLSVQPGEADPRHFIAAAKSEDGAFAVIYLPVGGEVRLRAETLQRPAPARWFDPRAGAWTDAGTVEEAEATFTAPGGDDWVLCIGPAR